MSISAAAIRDRGDRSFCDGLRGRHRPCRMLQPLPQITSQRVRPTIPASSARQCSSRTPWPRRRPCRCWLPSARFCLTRAAKSQSRNRRIAPSGHGPLPTPDVTLSVPAISPRVSKGEPAHHVRRWVSGQCRSRSRVYCIQLEFAASHGLRPSLRLLQPRPRRRRTNSSLKPQAHHLLTIGLGSMSVAMLDITGERLRSRCWIKTQAARPMHLGASTLARSSDTIFSSGLEFSWASKPISRF